MSNYVFLGPPGAGKGTMAERFTEHCGHVHISTGDILRAEMKSGSELGERVSRIIESGRLVPDETVTEIVVRRLGAADVMRSGFLLDGFPRTVAQAELLEAALDSQERSLDTVVLFEVEPEILRQRLTARRVCPECGAVYNVLSMPPRREGVCDKCGAQLVQRSDDSPETVENRLRVYREQTEPLVDYYRARDRLVTVDASGRRDEVFAALCRQLEIA